MAPNLALAGRDVALTWLEPLVDPRGRKIHRLRFARLAAGRWSAPVTIVSGPNFFANWADFPALGEGRDGALVAHWLAKTGDGTYDYAVNLARSADRGATWNRIGLLHDDGIPAEHGFVSWVTEQNGLTAFWLDGRETPKGGTMALWTARVGQKAGVGERLDDRVCDCCQTDAALAVEGPVVAYRDRSDQEIRDIYVIRRSASGWSRPVRVAADRWQIPGCPVNGPAIDASGRRVAVAWFTAAPPEPRVQVAFSDDGGATFGPAVRVDGGRPLGRVDLVLDSAGEAIVSWLEHAEGRGAAVRLRRVRSGRAGEPVEIAATSAARSSGFPRLLRVGDRLHLAWVEDGDGDLTRLRAGSLPLAAVPAPGTAGR